MAVSVVFAQRARRQLHPRAQCRYAFIPSLKPRSNTDWLCPLVSGLSAAHTIYLAGGNVVVLDKQGFFGGNSTKATSGINGALTRTQVDSNIKDSVKQFYDDTLKSARDKARPDLIKVLTYKSAAAVEWLQDVFNLDLTLVSRLG